MTDFLYGSAKLALAIALVGIAGIAMFGSIEWQVNGLPRVRDRFAVALVDALVVGTIWIVFAVNIGARR